MDDIMNMTVQVKKNFIEVNETALFLWEHMKNRAQVTSLTPDLFEATGDGSV